MTHLNNTAVVHPVDDLQLIAQEITRKKVADLLPELKGAPIEAIILYGSSAQPKTLRKESDLDLKVIVKLERFDDDFKYHYSNKAYVFNDKKVEVELKYYTLESFRKELLFGSFTRLFALLNAYKILSDQSEEATKIIQLAHERMDQIIAEVKTSLSNLNLDKEITTLRNYMSKSYSSLLSEKLKENRFGLGLRLFEYSKYFIIQFERLSFAQQLQSGKEAANIDVYIKNILMFQQHDGNRILDYYKYEMDETLTTIVNDVNQLIQSSDDLRTTVKRMYDYFNKVFLASFGVGLFIDKDATDEYFTFQTVGK